jgi:cell division protein FtsX
MNERVTLVTIAGGAALELFEHELSRVLANIADLNTNAGPQRAITIQVQFKPAETRESSEITLQVTSKLAGIKAVRKEVYLGKQDGQHVAMQFNPRQAGLNFDPTPTAEDLRRAEQQIKDANLDR